jgi:uncharacterized protein (TIGR04222 family)
MNQPWGLSGPQFLWIYGTGMAAFVAAPWLLVLLARTFGTASPQAPTRVLDAYEVGYLAGGAQRAAEVVIGELTASAALRVDSVGQISQADTAELAAWSATCAHGIAAHAVPNSLNTQKVMKRLAKDPGIVAIGVRLRAERLLIARSWVIAAQVTALALWLALMVAGALRMAEGAHNHRPIGDLAKLYLLTVLLGIVSRRRWLERLTWTRTRAGAADLKRLGQQEVLKQVKDQLAAQREMEAAAQKVERKARRAGRRALQRGGTLPVGDAVMASTAFPGAAVTDLRPEQEALCALHWNVPRRELSMAAQLEYDRLRPAWERGEVWPAVEDLEAARLAWEHEPAGTAPAWSAAPLPGLTAAGGDAALLGIALAGLAAVEDPTLRTALLAGMPSSGGGGGCGGGGCGGGGCGG